MSKEFMTEILSKGPIERIRSNPFKLVPSPSNNLFLRTIRKTVNVPKERECTELLCAIMRNSATVRNKIIGFLLEYIESPKLNLSEYKFTIDTENQVAGKLDDLRITGESSSEPRNNILLIIEIKVQSGWSYSYPLDKALPPDKKIHQLVNYDYWLNNQGEFVVKGGLVISKKDLSKTLPAGLSCRWECLTWTNLALFIAKIIREEKLEDWESFLLRHYLGFLQVHLVEEKYMIKPVTNFDLTLHEAFKNHHSESESLISTLIESAEDAFSDLLESDEIMHQRMLFHTHYRDVIGFNFQFDGEATSTYVFAGLVLKNEPVIAFWVETDPNAYYKDSFNDILEEKLSELSSVDKRWVPVENQRRGYWDIQIRVPSREILEQKNQSEWFSRLVDSGVRSLLHIDIREILRNLIKKTD